MGMHYKEPEMVLEEIKVTNVTDYAIISCFLSEGELGGFFVTQHD